MRNKAFILIATAICFALIAGCATTIKPIPAQDLNEKLQSGALVQTTNNFEVILDTSASMYDPHKWSHYGYTDKLKTTKLEYEGEIGSGLVFQHISVNNGIRIKY
jgi:hypothetical protein